MSPGESISNASMHILFTRRSHQKQCQFTHVASPKYTTLTFSLAPLKLFMHRDTPVGDRVVQGVFFKYHGWEIGKVKHVKVYFSNYGLAYGSVMNYC